MHQVRRAVRRRRGDVSAGEKLLPCAKHDHRTQSSTPLPQKRKLFIATIQQKYHSLSFVCCATYV
jgi:hypothetical protein